MQENENKEQKVEKDNLQASKKFIGVFLSNIVAVPSVNITCDIANPEEAKNLKIAFDRREDVVLVSSKEGKPEPTINDFCEVGCLCSIKQFSEEQSHTKVLLFGKCRVKVVKIESLMPEFILFAQELPELNENSVLAHQKMKALKDDLKQLNQKARFLPPVLEAQLSMEANPSVFSDVLVHVLAKDNITTQQTLLSIQNVEERLQMEEELAKNFKEILGLRKKIDEKVNENLSKTQYNMFQ